MDLFHHGRRRFLASTAALALFSVVRKPAWAASRERRGIPPAPRARIEPVIDDYYGTKVIDSYRWMEDPDDPDWLPFMRKEQAHTRAVLDAMPGRDEMARRISKLTGDTVTTGRLTSIGDTLFYLQRPVGANAFKLFVQPSGAVARILIDPDAMGTDEHHVSLDWWATSFDGRYVAYGLSPAGSEASVLHVMEVASGIVLPERIDKTDAGLVRWLPDGSGFFYLQLTGERGSPDYYLNSVTKLHRLGTGIADDSVVFAADTFPQIAVKAGQFPTMETTPGSAAAIAIVRDDGRQEIAAYSAPIATLLAGVPAWRRICGFDDLVVDFARIGDQLYVLSNKGHPRGKVLLTSLSEPDLATAHEIMPESEMVLQSLRATRDGVLVQMLDGGISALRKIGLDGAATPIALPFDGAIQGITSRADQDGAYLGMTGWLQPQRILPAPQGRLDYRHRDFAQAACRCHAL